MRARIYDSAVVLWLSRDDTRQWAERPGSRWPCSYLSGKRVMCSFDASGLVDITINGRYGDCPSSEFNAITSDYLRERLPENHPAWFVAVGQFQEGASHA